MTFMDDGLPPLPPEGIILPDELGDAESIGWWYFPVVDDSEFCELSGDGPGAIVAVRMA
jgi:hypothetical protein